MQSNAIHFTMCFGMSSILFSRLVSSFTDVNKKCINISAFFIDYQFVFMIQGEWVLIEW